MLFALFGISSLSAAVSVSIKKAFDFVSEEINIVDKADVCKIFVYADNIDVFRWPPRVNRHNGFVFVLEQESGQPVGQFRIDYNMHSTFKKGFVSVNRNAPPHSHQQRLLAVALLRSKQQKSVLYEIWSKMLREYEVFYDFRHARTNCRGYVLQHIGTITQAIDVPADLQRETIQFVENAVILDKCCLAIPGVVQFVTTTAIVPSATHVAHSSVPAYDSGATNSKPAAQ